LEYLGPHEPFEMVLLDFVAGTMVRRKTLVNRPSYAGNKVIDMDRLKRDWKFNDVSDRSFFYLDRDFFTDTPVKSTVSGTTPKTESKSPKKSPKKEESKKEEEPDFALIARQLKSVTE